MGYFLKEIWEIELIQRIDKTVEEVVKMSFEDYEEKWLWVGFKATGENECHAMPSGGHITELCCVNLTEFYTRNSQNSMKDT